MMKNISKDVINNNVENTQNENKEFKKWEYINIEERKKEKNNNKKKENHLIKES